MSNSTDPATRLPAYTLQELAKHNKVDDAWISINGFVYDITDFADGHPGGTGVILRYAGELRNLSGGLTINFRQRVHTGVQPTPRGTRNVEVP